MKLSKRLEYLLDNITDEEWSQFKLGIEQRKSVQHAERVANKIDTCEAYGDYLLKHYTPTVDKKYWQDETGDIYNSKQLYFEYLTSLNYSDEEE